MIKANGNRVSMKGGRFGLQEEFCAIVNAFYRHDALCPGDNPDEKRKRLMEFIDIALGDDEDDDLPKTGDGVTSLSDMLAKVVDEWMESEDGEPQHGKE